MGTTTVCAMGLCAAAMLVVSRGLAAGESWRGTVGWAGAAGTD
jgi:hypothetical protein